MALHGHSAPVTCLASCGLEATDGDVVLSGSADGTALLWSLRRLTASYLTATARRPTASRCPSLVVRGHRGPVTACAVSDGLGLALTCSDGRALLTSTEGNVLLRTLRYSVKTASPPQSRNGDSDAGAGQAGVEGAKTSSPATLNPPAIRYTACALAEAGYAALAGSRQTPELLADGRSSAEEALVSHELEVYTVNGRRTAKLAGVDRAIRCLSTAGRGDLLVIGGEGLMLEVRTTVDLAPLWSLDPHSWATIDTFSGSGSGGGGAAGQGVRMDVDEKDWPAVECVELGPNPNAPIVVCVGTADGSLLVQVRLGAIFCCLLPSFADGVFGCGSFS